jgi:6-phosphofructokinase 1
MAFGNLALDLVMDNRTGRMVCLRNGIYDNVPIEVVTSTKKVIDVDKYYDKDRLRPLYKSFNQKPFFIMTSDF